MPVQTRIFRKLQHTVNGLLAYILGTVYDAAPESRIDTTGWSQAGIRVWYRNNVGVETEITAGVPVAIVNIPAGTATVSANWNCPLTLLVSTDAIVVRLYFGPAWTLQRTWITEQLGASQLDAVVWTVNHGFVLWAGTVYWRHSVAPSSSDITNFSWTPAAVAVRQIMDGFIFVEG